jgi:hypothetical protein
MFSYFNMFSVKQVNAVLFFSILFSALCSTLFISPLALAEATRSTPSAELYKESPIELGHISLGKNLSANSSDLCLVAEKTARYLTEHTEDNFAVHPGNIFSSPSLPHVSLNKVKNTLNFICEIHQEDLKNNRKSRLTDNNFLKQHFDFVRWLPDKTTATNIANKSTNKVKTRLLQKIPTDKLFLTKYYTKLLTASAVKTNIYTQALYALPYDEKGISLKKSEDLTASLNRFKYTRQQVIAGALLKNKLATPLVWLTEDALHDVLLQGTGVLDVGGKRRYFNVHRNNGIAYNYSIGKTEQARYWYFIETPEIMGYGKDQASKIAIKSQVTFAGNVADIGLGKLMMVSYETSTKATATSLTGTPQPHKIKTVSRLGILADQGGAFDNNLFQLDFLVGSYQGWRDYHQDNKHLPDYARAWFMLLKD